jgi:inositol phosphorylceramide mannosyltransferase catalytic subunit
MSRIIPPIFHRVWLGGSEPARQWAWEASWRRLHPRWQMVTWTDETLPPLRNQRLFDAAASPAQKSDIARYELLHRFGGVYLDTDMEALQPLDELLDGVGFFCASEDDIWLSVGILGCPPGDPVAGALVEALAPWVAARPDAAVNVQTGPYFFTRTVNRLRNDTDRPSLTVFGPGLFYPYHFSEPERAGGPFPGAYAVHHWSHS